MKMAENRWNFIVLFILQVKMHKGVIFVYLNYTVWLMIYYVQKSLIFIYPYILYGAIVCH